MSDTQYYKAKELSAPPHSYILEHRHGRIIALRLLNPQTFKVFHYLELGDINRCIC